MYLCYNTEYDLSKAWLLKKQTLLCSMSLHHSKCIKNSGTKRDMFSKYVNLNVLSKIYKNNIQQLRKCMREQE